MLDFFLQLPESVQLGIVALVSSGAGGFAKLLYDMKKPDRINHVTKMPKLIYHPLFVQLDMLENWVNTRYTQPDHGRTELSKEMILHKIRIWRPILLKFARTTDTCFKKCGSKTIGHCNKTYNSAMTTLTEGLAAYVGWHQKPVVMSADGTRIYEQADKDTMDIYVKKFQEWHASREELVTQMTKQLGESSIYDNCLDRAWDILTVYQMAFVGMRPDMERSLYSLNGSLTGRTFLGTTIGDCDRRKTPRE
jgi:hypothetical protein